MTEEKNNEKKHCGRKKGAMLAYGFIQLGTSIVSAVSLVAISFSLCSLKEESRVFTECVEEVKETGKSSSQAVRFCNGGR